MEGVGWEKRGENVKGRENGKKRGKERGEKSRDRKMWGRESRATGKRKGEV